MPTRKSSFFSRYNKTNNLRHQNVLIARFAPEEGFQCFAKLIPTPAGVASITNDARISKVVSSKGCARTIRCLCMTNDWERLSGREGGFAVMGLFPMQSIVFSNCKSACTILCTGDGILTCC